MLGGKAAVISTMSYNVKNVFFQANAVQQAGKRTAWRPKQGPREPEKQEVTAGDDTQLSSAFLFGRGNGPVPGTGPLRPYGPPLP